MRFLLLFILVVVLSRQSAAVTVMAIDLGSEWMKIAIVKPGVPMEIVLNKETKRKTAVAIGLKDGERLFGSSAVAQGVRFPKNTYIYLLDLLAKKMDNPLVQKYKERFPYYDLVEDPITGYIQFRHDKENNILYSPEELLAMTLNYSRSLAEEYAQQSVDFTFITVPAYFNQAERKMLLYSASLAGLPSPQLMDVNTAAALNYGVFRRNDINATATYIMFYDMGATSTTATVVAYQVVKVNGIADPQVSVKGVGFDRTLGGFEMEFRLRDYLIKLFDENKKTKSDVRTSPKAMAKLLKEARRLKLVLSANAEHQARVESLIDDEDFKAKVTREDFEALCSDLWPRFAKPIQEALSSAGLTMDLISKLILVGGGTRVPKVQELLLAESGMSSLGKSLNADEAPALGASYEAAARSKAFRVKTFHVKFGAVYPVDIDFARVTAHEDGSTTVKNVRKTLFQRNNPYPQRKVITFNKFYTDFGFSVNYGGLKFLTEDQLKIFGSTNISTVQLQGVDAAHELHGGKNDTDSKGIKAHFRMDENGILNLEEVESVYESSPPEMEEKDTTTDEDTSAFEKIKNSFTSMFGGGEQEAPTEETVSTSFEKETKEEEEKETMTGGEKEKADSGEEGEADSNQEGGKDLGDGGSEKEKEESSESKETESEKEKDGGKLKDGDSKPEEKPENKTEVTEAKKKPKKVKIAVPLTKSESRLDYIEHTTNTFNISKAKLQELSDRDALKVAREEAMNALEAYIYDKQDKASYQDEYTKAMTDTEQEEIPKALREASDWMFELEEEVAPEVYREKLKELRALARPWLLRVKQRQDLEPLLKDIETIFNYTSHFIKAIDGLPEDDQIYTEVEINLLKKTYNDTVAWKNDTISKQQSLLPSADNILKPEDVNTKIRDLNREVQYLLNKARTAKPKKKVETGTNSTKSDKGKTANETETVENAAEKSKETKIEGEEKIVDGKATSEDTVNDAQQKDEEATTQEATKANVAQDKDAETVESETESQSSDDDDEKAKDELDFSEDKKMENEPKLTADDDVENEPQSGTPAVPPTKKTETANDKDDPPKEEL